MTPSAKFFIAVFTERHSRREDPDDGFVLKGSLSLDDLLGSIQDEISEY